MLLHYVGGEVFDIYTSLLTPGEEKTYENIIKLFDEHFNPKKNISYEVYKFRNLKQRVDESIQKYYVRIKEQAMKCDFKTNLKKEIKQQIELSTNSNKLGKVYFTVHVPTLHAPTLHINFTTSEVYLFG